MIIFGVLPFLGGAAVAGMAFVNSRQQVPNRAFMPVAWHNLPTTKIFPEHFGRFEHAWARQGIDGRSSCESPPLRRDLADAVNEHGCRAVLRATYVDTTNTLVTTIAIIVFGKNRDVQAIAGRFDPQRGEVGLVAAYPVPDSPAAGWKDAHRVAVSTRAIGFGVKEEPYLLVATVGYVDGRPVRKLPQPWTLPAPGSANESSLDDAASGITSQFQEAFYQAIVGTDG